MRVQSLFIYPFKSGPGVPVSERELTERGFADDRRYLVVDSDGKFLTQRTHPALGRTTVTVDEGGLLVENADLGQVRVPRPTPSAPRFQVTVWSDIVDAMRCSDEAASWFSELLHTPVQVVWMPEEAHRPADGAPEVALSFADASPYLLTTTASLADLNDRIAGEPVPMEAFRPSIVIDDAEAWQEDDWSQLQIGAAMFDVTGDCERCKVTTLDPTCPDRPRRDGEPLRTLARFRRNDSGKVALGRYLVCRTPGQVIRVGDELQVRA